MKEHLVSITTKDGEPLEFHKDDKDILICRKDHCVILPNATGLQTSELFALLEPLGEGTSFPEESVEGHAVPEEQSGDGGE